MSRATSPHDMWAHYGLNDTPPERPKRCPNLWPVAFEHDPYAPRLVEKRHKIGIDEIEMLENEAL